MKFQTDVRGRQFACNSEREGVFELVGGAYRQHRGTGETPAFRDEAHFRRYVQRMFPRREGRPNVPGALSEALQLRVSREQLARYQAAASAASVTLPEWVRSTLDSAVR